MHRLILVMIAVAVAFTGCNVSPESMEMARNMLKQQGQIFERGEIIAVINQLFISTDDKDWDGVRECFADTVLFDMSSMGGGEPEKKSAQEIIDGWKEGLAEIDQVHHRSSNFIINVQEESAYAFCYGIAMHYTKTESGGKVRSFTGSYDMHLAKDGNKWRIDEFTFILKFIDEG